MSQTCGFDGEQAEFRMLAPVAVQIAGNAIIVTRCLAVVLLVHEMGLEAIVAFIYRSAQSWQSTLLFVASQLLFFTELHCALVLKRGVGYGRWGFVIAQMVTAVWLWLSVTAGDGSRTDILEAVLLQRFPDLVIVWLLYIPASSRRFFRRR